MRETRRARSRHLNGGVYYVVRRSRHPGQPIFTDALDYATFERFLALALARYRCRLHAFYWEPHAIHMAMQVGGRPIGRFLQWLCSWYSRSVSQHAVKASLFEQSYQATLIEPGESLLALIRYLHLRAVGAGVATEPADSALSSHHAYLGVVHIPWLTTSAVLHMLAPSLEQGRLEYRWMMQRLEEDPAELFAGIERYRQLRPRLFDLPSLRERNVESLQIRALPVPPRKDSRL
jgi:hypothetical protein